MKFVDLFAGALGIQVGLENVKITFDLNFSEIFESGEQKLANIMFFTSLTAAKMLGN